MTDPIDIEIAHHWLANELSTAEIGRRLNMTKNALVGRAHRMNLPAKPTPIRPAAIKPEPLTASLDAMAVIAALSALRYEPPVVIGRSSDGCLWPIGEPGTRGFRFCDDAPVRGKPYCLQHCRNSYVRLAPEIPLNPQPEPHPCHSTAL